MITNPNAAVIIYSYRDRLGSQRIDDTTITENDTEDMVITEELISVRTSKVKSAPAGNFEIQLAPSINWITAITPGSWCVILMSRNTITLPQSSETAGPEQANTQQSNDTGATQDKSDNSSIVKESELRMIGRIDSVRLSSVVSPDGTISSAYVATGVDWGSIFDSYFYLDSAFKPDFANQNGSIVLNEIYQQYLAYGRVDSKSKKKGPQADQSSSKKSLISGKTTTEAIRTLLLFWGNPKPFESQEIVDGGTDRLLGKALNQFSIPENLAKYLGFEASNKVTTSICELIKLRGGVLVNQDTYSDNDDKSDLTRSDGVSIINSQSLFSMNTMWQMLMAHCNPTLNEMLCDIRFEEGRPNLTLYKRIKPFSIKNLDYMSPEEEAAFEKKDSAQQQKTVKDRENAINYAKSLSSNFKNIRNIEIALEDIISINAGTNWKDRVNFIEVRTTRNEPFLNMVGIWGRPEFQVYDNGSIKRDGILPMIGQVTNIPFTVDRSSYDYNNIAAYKYLLREWFFDTHRMLNGAISVVGQDKYIQVGDNILVPAKVLGATYNYSSQQQVSNALGEELYLLAHVESISHNSLVDPNGARSFFTDIQFVRGIIVIGSEMQGDLNLTLDQDRSYMSGNPIKNSATASSYASSNKPKSDNKWKGG
jgi:hypothetical protein